MKKISVKRKINQLLTRYPQKSKMERYEALANDLYISPRWVIYLKDGKRMSNIHLANAINRLRES